MKINEIRYMTKLFFRLLPETPETKVLSEMNLINQITLSEE